MLRALWLAVAATSIASCGASGTPSPSGGTDPDGGMTSSGSSGGSGAEAGAASTDDGGVSSSGIALMDGSDWTCPESMVLGGYAAACVTCIESTCATQFAQCETSSCATCEGPVFTCVTQSCSSACGTGGSDDSGADDSGAGDSSASSSGACATLSACCSLIATYEPTYASTCTSIASGGNESSCQEILSMLGSAAALCM